MKKIVALVLSLVMVLGLATTAFAVNPVVQQWDPTGGTDGKGAWVNWYAPSAAGDYDLSDFAKGADENYLPCYEFGTGNFFVETTEAAATYKAVYGATVVYLAKVEKSDVYYTDNADVFTNVTKETDECGKLVVTDTTKTYYVAYDEANKNAPSYYVATKNGGTQLLVDGKIVDVKATASTAVTPHSYKGNDVVDNVYTTVKCENCGKVAKLYATATAAGKNAVGPIEGGYITLADWISFTVAPAADAETDKVESAETFDAGIAMYVGMSVMAAAGSAVVLKKKD